jgi:hypothetical protein
MKIIKGKNNFTGMLLLITFRIFFAVPKNMASVILSHKMQER